MPSQDIGSNAVEATLSKVLRDRSGFELSSLDRSATFLELGFDSLFLIQLSQEIRKIFQVKVTFRQLIEEVTTVGALLSYLEANVSQVASRSAPAVDPGEPSTAAAESAAPALPVQQAVPEPPAVAEQPVRAEPAPPPLPRQAPAARQPVDDRLNAHPIPRGGNGLHPLSDIQQIILQQNELMARHLDLLQGVPPTHDDAVRAPAAAPPLTSSKREEPEAASASAVCADTPADLPTTHVTPPASPAGATARKSERFGPYKPVRRGANEGGLTDRQRKHLDELIARYTRKTAKSRAHAQTHRDHFADPRGVAGYRRIWKSMVYQIAVERSKGSKLWDIDGNEYVDIAMGFGLNLFGQSPDFITEALQEQLLRGVEVGPQSVLAGEVAQLLCDFSRKERVTFCNTGSEAVMAALRLARTATGKSKFVFFNQDYHGNFDQVLVRSSLIGSTRRSSPAAPGVPQAYADNAIVLDYGSPEALRVIDERADEIAAVLIEPVQSADPFTQPREFLHEIRRITRAKKIAMIVDEVISGFRAAQGGAQEWFDVWGDMATYGKILGGGMPIGALAGSAEYMDGLDGGTWRYEDGSEPEADMTFFAGTFVRHPLAIAAAHQVLMKLKDEGPELPRQLTAKTTYLADSLNNFFESELFPIRIAQFSSLFRFMFPSDLEYADMLYFHLLDRGVFTRGWGDNCFLSTAHSDEDIERIIDAVKDSCLEIRRGGFFPDAGQGPAESDRQAATPQESEQPQSLLAASPQPATLSIQTESAMSTLTEIQEEGDLPPLFCLPAADGFTRVYHELACHLPNHPIYGLHSPAIFGETLPDTLEELVARFVGDIRQQQPQGPYFLIGYCSGGTLALEAAQQLIASGQRVALLACIETYNWLGAPSTNPTRWVQTVYHLQRLDFHFRNFWLLNSRQKWEFFKSKLATARARSKVWRASVARFLTGKAGRPGARQLNFAEIWKKHDELAEAYVPRPYPGRLFHLRPRRDYACHANEELKATGGVEIRRMRAYPAGMMASPFVAEVADELKSALAEGLGQIPLAGTESEESRAFSERQRIQAACPAVFASGQTGQ